MLGRQDENHFGVDFLGDRNNSGHFPERRYKMLVYGGLEEVSNHATELISVALRPQKPEAY